MSELISKEQAMAYPLSYEHYDKVHGSEKFISGVESYRDYIDGLPTVEAKEVVKARFKLSKKRKAIFLDNADEQYKVLGYPHRNILQLRCSNCELITSVDESILYHFCPHCGAKIDEVEE